MQSSYDKTANYKFEVVKWCEFQFCNESIYRVVTSQNNTYPVYKEEVMILVKDIIIITANTISES